MKKSDGVAKCSVPLRFLHIQASLSDSEKALGYNEEVRPCGQMLRFPAVSETRKPRELGGYLGSHWAS